MYLLSLIFLKTVLLILVLTGCGKGFKEDEEKEVLRQEEELNQVFHARLNKLNNFGNFRGWFELSIMDNQIWARIKVMGPQLNISHQQFMHTGLRCPDMGDDSNGDGVLDFDEVTRVSGPVLVPLDTNITSQYKGLGEYPFIERNRQYYYSESSSFSAFMRDLRSVDPFPSDIYIKLKKNKTIEPERMVVIIYGISEAVILPANVATFDGYPPQYAVPILCGVIDNGPSPEFELGP